MHSNNETGVLQPVTELAALARAAGALVHTDAAQSVGKVPVSVGDLDVDLLTVAGHKLYAPKGIGALYVRKGTPLEPFMRGGGQERGLRPGTENVASDCRPWRCLCSRATRSRPVRGTHEATARRSMAPAGRCNSRPCAERPSRTAPAQHAQRADSRCIGRCRAGGAPELAASTGSACHAGNTSASAVILAMGVDPDEALGSVRLTLGRTYYQRPYISGCRGADSRLARAGCRPVSVIRRSVSLT